MTDEELLKKDFQLLISRSATVNEALLRTILMYQAKILSNLTNENGKDILGEMNERIKKESEIVDEIIKNKIPDYPKIT